MSNRLFNFVTQFISGSVAKSSEVNAQFSAVDVAASAIELELNRAIKFPAAESSTNQVIVETSANRVNRLLGFDGSGNLITATKFTMDWDMNGKRLRNLITAVASDEPVTLGQLNAYSVSLVAGLPSISGKNGPLTTDGASVIWDSANRLIPDTTSQQPCKLPIWTGGTVQWSAGQVNLVWDPNGMAGSTTYWNASQLSVAALPGGYVWTQVAALVAATFEHLPNANGFCPSAGNVSYTVAVTSTLSAANFTAGTISLGIRWFDGAKTLISDSSTAAIVGASGRIRTVLTATSPAGALYMKPVIKFAGASVNAGALILREMKLENGAIATYFSDDTTLFSVVGQKSSNQFGAGFATPIIYLGDTSTTAPAVRFRSQTGAQDYDTAIGSAGGTNGVVSKGTMTLYAKSVQASNCIGFVSEYNAGNSGAAITIDWTNGGRQKVTLTAATPAITFSNPTGVGMYRLKIVQDGTGGRAPTFVGFVAADCVGNALPSIASAVSGVTFLDLYWDGTQYWVSGNMWD